MRRPRRNPDAEQVANACDSFVNLAPVSDLPAQLIRDAWAATLPRQSIPKIGERHGYQ